MSGEEQSQQPRTGGEDEERERFREALERKAERSRQRAEATGRPPSGPPPAEHEEPIEQSLISAARPPDVLSPRDKSEGHGKKTADKWNQ